MRTEAEFLKYNFVKVYSEFLDLGFLHGSLGKGGMVLYQVFSFLFYSVQ